MKISVKHLEILFKKYRHDLKIRYLFDLKTKTNLFLSGDFMLENHMDIFRNSGIENIDIHFDGKMYELMTAEFPCEYRRAYATVDFMELDRRLETLDRINTLSGRKRHFIMIGDIYGFDQKTLKKSILIEHGEPVDYKKWNTVKRVIEKNRTFSYRNSEVPIIIFVNLTTNSHAGYIERFKKNVDLVTCMLSCKMEKDHKIANDFINTEDIISVTEPDALFDVYVKSCARLIIIGEELDQAYKNSLINVKRYDKFVRMLVVPAIDHRNLDHFFRQVKLVYNSDKWND